MIKIPTFLRCINFQILTFCLLATGGVLGMYAADGYVLLSYGGYTIKRVYASTAAILLMFAALLILSRIVKPIFIQVAVSPRSKPIGIFMAWAYVSIAYLLLIHNIIRLDVINFFIEGNPGAIAFRLTEERGVVLLYTTMLCYFIGASYLFDNSKKVATVYLLRILSFIFLLGLLVTTRREMVIVMLVWAVTSVAVGPGKNSKLTIVVMGVFSVLFLYVSLLFREIDFLRNPLDYFLSGEFEPFRFSMLLVDRWIEDPEIHSPIPFSFPFLGNVASVDSVNCFINYQFTYEDTCLGKNTVTLFSTFLYFGFVPTIIFYVIAVFFYRQMELWTKFTPTSMNKFLFSFAIVRLFLYIRNGELLNSLIDNIVLSIELSVFLLLVGYRITRIKK